MIEGIREFGLRDYIRGRISYWSTIYWVWLHKTVEGRPALRDRFMQWQPCGTIRIHLKAGETYVDAFARRKPQGDITLRGLGFIEWKYGEPVFDAAGDYYTLPTMGWGWKHDKLNRAK